MFCLGHGHIHDKHLRFLGFLILGHALSSLMPLSWPQVVHTTRLLPPFIVTSETCPPCSCTAVPCSQLSVEALFSVL